MQSSSLDTPLQSESSLEHYLSAKKKVIDAAREEQTNIDPQGLFSCLPETERNRLLTALVRFFVLKNGTAPYVPITREETVKIFHEARRMGNLPTAQKLFPFFMACTKERLAEYYGIEIRQVTKKTQKDPTTGKTKSAEKENFLYILRSLLPPTVRSEMLTAQEIAWNGVLAVVVCMVSINRRNLSRKEIIKYLTDLGFEERLPHEMFGNWEVKIFDAALKRRYLLLHRRENQEMYSLGEGAFDEFGDKGLEQWFNDI